MPPPADPAATFDPSALARFGRLELIARLVVEGVMSGLHKSPFKGFSVEFAEHRQYGPGDEIRHIDWRALGKTDRYFVKEYEEETNLKAYLVVDTSGSMGYAGRTASKFEHARQLAAALSYLMISQRDAVGLVTFDTEFRAMIPPRSAPGHFSTLCRALESAAVGGEVPLSGLLHTLADRIKRRSLVVVLSDGFDKLADLTSAPPPPPPPPARGPLPPRPGPRGGGVPVPPPRPVPRPRKPRPDPPRQPLASGGLPGEVRAFCRDLKGAADGRRLPPRDHRPGPRQDPARLPRRPLRPGAPGGLSDPWHKTSNCCLIRAVLGRVE